MGEIRCCDCAYFCYDFFRDAEEEIDAFECIAGHNDIIGWGKPACVDYISREGMNGTNC